MTSDPVTALLALCTGALTFTNGELEDDTDELCTGALTFANEPVASLPALSTGALTLTSGDPEEAPPLLCTGALALTSDPVGVVPGLEIGALTFTNGDVGTEPEPPELLPPLDGLVVPLPELATGTPTFTNDPVGEVPGLAIGALTFTNGDVGTEPEPPELLPPLEGLVAPLPEIPEAPPVAGAEVCPGWLVDGAGAADPPTGALVAV